MTASRSPTGAWSNTARMTAQARGIVIIDTVRPAMKTELVNWVCCQMAACGSVSTRKIGMKLRYSLNQREMSMACGISRKKPQRP